jgi:hypothetical protein
LRASTKQKYIFSVLDNIKFPTRDINKILSIELDVLRRSARKSRMERIKNEQITEVMGVKGKADIIDIIEKKRLQ